MRKGTCLAEAGQSVRDLLCLIDNEMLSELGCGSWLGAIKSQPPLCCAVFCCVVLSERQISAAA